MKIYFARRKGFLPANRKEKPIDYFRGFLNFVDKRPGDSPSGQWVVFYLAKNQEEFRLYFDSANVSDEDFVRYKKFEGERIILRSHMDVPEIFPVLYHSEDDLRYELIEGVIAGTVNKDDLNALMEFERGNDMVIENWQIFKQQIATEGLEKAKEDLEKKKEKAKFEIEVAKDEVNSLNEQLAELNKFKAEAEEQKLRLLDKLGEILMTLQGEEYLEGEQNGLVNINRPTENLVHLRDGYAGLIKALEQFRTGKGIYVIADGKIHKIHHAYHEGKGPVFLIGSSREYLKTKPEKVKEIIDKVFDLLFPNKRK